MVLTRIVQTTSEGTVTMADSTSMPLAEEIREK
jgi:hypothetical protein